MPDGLTVGGDLYLRGCTGLTALPDGLTVGGYLSLDGSNVPSSERRKVNNNAPSVFRWEFHGRQYIKADGIFQRVISHHGNVYRVRRIGQTNETYLVTDGAGKWSHGETLEEARRDLLYKIGNRDTSRYKGLTLESVFPLAEAIECYRVITGACAAGTKHFMEGMLPEKERKEAYSVAEMIRLTAGQYGADTFRQFFESKR